MIDDKKNIFDNLNRLRTSNSNPTDFWGEYLDQCLRMVNGIKGTLLVRSKKAPEWRRIVEKTIDGKEVRNQYAYGRRLKHVASKAADEGLTAEKVESDPIAGQGDCIIAIRLVFSATSEVVVLIVLLSKVAEEEIQHVIDLLRLVADIPKSYQLNQSINDARGEVQKFSTVMDFVVEVNEHRKIQACVLAICNGMAGRFKCERVSFGWLKGGYIRLLGMSRTDRVDHKTEAARIIEAAMEEACDQDEDIVYPEPKGENYISLAHQKLAEKMVVENTCSTPIRDSNKVIAALTFERNNHAFSDLEIEKFRLSADLIARQLVDLKRYDRWFGARWISCFGEYSTQFFGVKNTWAKILAITISVLLAVLFFVKVDYRVEGKVMLRSDEVAFITAPFDGYIDEVVVKAGDKVNVDDVLLRLNTDELLLQKAAASADLNRYNREIDKSRATGELAEMRIYESLAMQSQAKLELVEYRIMQSIMKSEFDGIVVEGDLRQRLGAPVKQGESLFRLARMDSFYIEVEIEERDHHEVIGKEMGEVAFLSQPKLKFPIKISQLESAALSREGGNVFIARCDFLGEIKKWWRPGMSGLCKLNVGRRSLIWIFTHRTVDFLRMWLWW